MRANIYTINELQKDCREALHDGIGMTTALLGELAVVRELKVKLPLSPEGRVNYRRVGFGKLDPLTELHIMAVPLDKSASTDCHLLGIAHTYTGKAFVDTSSHNPGIIRTTTAHEVAHTLGFVREGSSHQDTHDPHHCVNENCLMHKSVALRPSYEEMITQEGIGFFQKTALRAKRKRLLKENRVNHQHDFCLDCKKDIFEHGQLNVANLRVNRLLGVNKL